MATLTVFFGGQEQVTYNLEKEQYVVGREQVCEICIDNLGISRKHCVILKRGEVFLVQDLGSSNGTYVNGKKIVEHFLNDSDEIFLGKYSLKFRNEAQAKAKVERPAAVPDTLNTYVMDGSKIREQLSKARAQAGGGTAKDYAQALAPAAPAAPAAQQTKVLKVVIIVFAIIIGILLAVVLFVATSKGGGEAPVNAPSAPPAPGAVENAPLNAPAVPAAPEPAKTPG